MKTFSRDFRRYVGFVALLVSGTVWGAATVTGINQVSSTRVGRTTYNFTYTINVTNGAPALSNAVATVTSSAAGTTIVQGTVALGTLTANSSSTSTSTFTLQQNRLVAFDPTSLTWNVTGAPLDVVPNVVGLGQAAASSAITGAGLTVGTVTQQSSSTVASGSVISESPTAGTQVNTGSAVNLVVSSGPQQVTVPNVVGQTQAAATSALTGVGLTVGTVTQQSSSNVASGSVISESPTAGTEVNTGSAVNLVISSGAGIGNQINFQPPPPPDPATVAAALPTNANGEPILLDLEGLQIGVASRPRGPVEGLAICTRWVAMCVQSSGNPSLDDCAHSAPACQTSTPWSESQCCPSTCFSNYQSQRLAGTSPSDAFKNVYLSGMCYPGIK